MRKGLQENKINLCLKKPKPHHDEPSTFLLAGRISAPSHAAPAGEPLLAEKATLLVPVSFHSLLPLPSSLIDSSSSSSCSHSSSSLCWLQRGAPLVWFAEGKGGKLVFGAGWGQGDLPSCRNWQVLFCSEYPTSFAGWSLLPRPWTCLTHKVKAEELCAHVLLGSKMPFRLELNLVFWVKLS